MVPHPEHEHMAVEGWPVFLSDNHHPVGRRQGMRPPARHEKLLVQDAVVLVRHLFEHQILILRLGHHHQVFKGVVQVAPIVHMYVRRSTVPAFLRHIDDGIKHHSMPERLPGYDVQRIRYRRIFESLDRLNDHLPLGEFHIERSRMMERPLPGAGCDARIRIGGCIKLVVGSDEMNPASCRQSVRACRRDGQSAHRVLPAALRDLHIDDLSAVGFKQLQLRQAIPVVDIGDPLPVRRPAGMKRVVVEERELVGFTSDGRLHIEVVELIRGAPRG